jgi:proline-specific peptidase
VRVSIGDARLYFDVSGAGWAIDHDGIHERPVLIGLHGGPGIDGTKHRYTLASLADAAQVIVPDQRGHGRSDLSDPERWNLATWAADVKGLSDALGIERPIVLGSSFGGFVAQKYAASYPDHPAGVILAGSCARILGGEELIERIRAVGGDEAADVMRRDLADPTEESFEESRRVIGPLMSLNPDPDPLVPTLDAARITTKQVNLSWFENEGNAMDLRPELANVRCPTLVLVGEHDPLTPIASVEEIVAAIPNDLARLQVVPNAAHDIVTDNPEFTNRCIRQFIAELT